MDKILLAFSVLSLMACGSEKETEEDTENSVFDADDNPDNVENSNCPSVVPEEYIYLWDCENTEGCAAKLYRYGVGESFDDGSFEVTEQWFSFSGPGDYCVDTFEITGSWDSREPSTYGGAAAEELFDISWKMVESQCGVIWSPLFADQEASDPNTQTYGGFMMFDTHGFGDMRNEDYNALVLGAPVNGNSYAPNSNYARGSVTPKAADHVGPGAQDENGDWCCSDELAGTFQAANYLWASAGDCLQ